MTRFFSILFVFWALLGASSQAQDSLNDFISSEAILTFCGDIKWQRVNRECSKVLDPDSFKLCNDLERNNPMYEEAEQLNYYCINSETGDGFRILNNLFEESTASNGCFSERVRSFYQNLINSPEYRELSDRFHDTLGIPLKIHYAFNANQNSANLQIDLSEVNDPILKIKSVDLALTAFSQKGPCDDLSSDAVISMISNELSRLTLIKSQATPKYGENPHGEKEIYDGGRATSNALKTEVEVFDAEDFATSDENSLRK